MSAQLNPLTLQVHDSLIPTTLPPLSAIPNPIHVREFKRSPRKNKDNKATHNGVVETSTTELATEV